MRGGICVRSHQTSSIAVRPSCVIASCKRARRGRRRRRRLRLSKGGQFTNRFRVVQICRIGVIRRVRPRVRPSTVQRGRGIDTSSNRTRNARREALTFELRDRQTERAADIIGLDTLMMNKGHADFNCLETDDATAQRQPRQSESDIR